MAESIATTNLVTNVLFQDGFCPLIIVVYICLSVGGGDAGVVSVLRGVRAEGAGGEGAAGVMGDGWPNGCVDA